MKIIAIKPDFEFEHEGVRLRAVECVSTKACSGCAGLEIFGLCSEYPCYPDQQPFKQKHSLIFQKSDNQNEEHN
jgi:hypothetical protein